METKIVSSLTSYGATYIGEDAKELEQVVGLQTDKPLKRAFMPYNSVISSITLCCEKLSRNVYSTTPFSTSSSLALSTESTPVLFLMGANSFLLTTSKHWVEPKRRGVFPLDRFHVPKKLAPRSEAIASRCGRTTTSPASSTCAAPAPGRETTWINGIIRRLYLELHAMGHAHSIEAYDGSTLVGGLYGVNLGGAFFGENMFHRATDASKVALVHLAGRLIAGGFRLLDAQFITPHLAQFGAEEIARATYQTQLGLALGTEGDFGVWPDGPAAGDGERALAAIASMVAARRIGPGSSTIGARGRCGAAVGLRLVG